METILLIVFVNIGNILCFIIGAKMGKNEKIEIPNPIKAVKNSIDNKREEKQIEEQITEYQKLFDNIENYDKPGYNQKEVRIDE